MCKKIQIEVTHSLFSFVCSFTPFLSFSRRRPKTDSPHFPEQERKREKRGPWTTKSCKSAEQLYGKSMPWFFAKNIFFQLFVSSKLWPIILLNKYHYYCNVQTLNFFLFLGDSTLHSFATELECLPSPTPTPPLSLIEQTRKSLLFQSNLPPFPASCLSEKKRKFLSRISNTSSHFISSYFRETVFLLFFLLKAETP